MLPSEEFAAYNALVLHVSYAQQVILVLLVTPV